MPNNRLRETFLSTSSSPTVTGSHLLAQALQLEGIRNIFMLVGDHILPALDVMSDYDFRFIDTRHEQAAMHMADAWARITGQPGVTMVTTPGFANVIPSLAYAMSSESPVLSISGSAELANIDRGIMQELDQINMAKPVTKGAWLVRDARRIPEYVALALRTAYTGRWGPVHLTIPIDIQEQVVDNSGIPLYTPQQSRGRAPVAADPAQIVEAIGLLRQAKKPVIIASNPAAYDDGSTAALERFLETTRVPLMNDESARGIVSDDHPYCMGFFDLSQNQAANLIKEADLVLILGKKLDFSVNYGQPPLLPADAKLIQVDPSPAELGRNRGVDIAMLGDIRVIVEQLADEAAKHTWTDLPWLDALRAKRAAQKEWFESYATMDTPIHPMLVHKTLEGFLKPEDTIVFDGGDYGHFGRGFHQARSPRSWFYLPNLGMLGSALPTAMAAKLARPHTRVVAVSGDGAFGFNGMELDTAVRHGLDVVTVVGNDAGWGIDKNIQEQFYGRTVAADLSPLRYDIVAQGLGAHGEYVEKAEELSPALERAFDAGKAALVNVRIKNVMSLRAQAAVAKRKSGGSSY
jgi:acetolactate synthase-1/2/3 large subunit